jgi:hypothetical protein
VVPEQKSKGGEGEVTFQAVGTASAKAPGGSAAESQLDGWGSERGEILNGNEVSWAVGDRHRGPCQPCV